MIASGYSGGQQRGSTRNFFNVMKLLHILFFVIMVVQIFIFVKIHRTISKQTILLYVNL